MIQKELDQITSELARISDETEFNGISILSGKSTKTVIGPSDSIADDVQYITTSGGITDKYTYNSNDYACGIVDFSNVTSIDSVNKLVGEGFSYTCCTCDKFYSIKFVNTTPDTSRLNAENPVMEVNVNGLSNGEDIVNAILKTAYGEDGYSYNPDDGYTSGGSFDMIDSNSNLPATATSFVEHYSKLDGDGAKLYVYDNRRDKSSLSWPSGENGKFELSVYGEVSQVPEIISELDFQVGSKKGNTITLELPIVTLQTMKLDDPQISIKTQEKASNAIEKFEYALSFVSGERGRVGAFQNRFEHTSTSLSITVENLQSAESRIRDADIAKEVMEHTKSSILSQSAQAMISQSNSMNQSILNLISMWK